MNAMPILEGLAITHLPKGAAFALTPFPLSADGAPVSEVTWRRGGGGLGGWGELRSPHPPRKLSPPPAGLPEGGHAGHAGGGAGGRGLKAKDDSPFVKRRGMIACHSLDYLSKTPGWIPLPGARAKACGYAKVGP